MKKITILLLMLGLNFLVGCKPEQRNNIIDPNEGSSLNDDNSSIKQPALKLVSSKVSGNTVAINLELEETEYVEVVALCNKSIKCIEENFSSEAFFLDFIAGGTHTVQVRACRNLPEKVCGPKEDIIVDNVSAASAEQKALILEANSVRRELYEAMEAVKTDLSYIQSSSEISNSAQTSAAIDNMVDVDAATLTDVLAASCPLGSSANEDGDCIYDDVVCPEDSYADSDGDCIAETVVKTDVLVNICVDEEGTVVEGAEFNTETGRCEQEAVCVVGDTSYSYGSDECTVDPVCSDDSVYDSVAKSCPTSIGGVVCEDASHTLTDDECVAPIVCEEGVYDSSTNVCNLTILNITCESASHTLETDAASGDLYCEPPLSCGTDETLSADGSSCESTIVITHFCPDGVTPATEKADGSFICLVESECDEEGAVIDASGECHIETEIDVTKTSEEHWESSSKKGVGKIGRFFTKTIGANFMKDLGYPVGNFFSKSGKVGKAFNFRKADNSDVGHSLFFIGATAFTVATAAIIAGGINLPYRKARLEKEISDLTALIKNQPDSDFDLKDRLEKIKTEEAKIKELTDVNIKEIDKEITKLTKEKEALEKKYPDGHDDVTAKTREYDEAIVKKAGYGNDISDAETRKTTLNTQIDDFRARSPSTYNAKMEIDTKTIKSTKISTNAKHVGISGATIGGLSVLLGVLIPNLSLVESKGPSEKIIKGFERLDVNAKRAAGMKARSDRLLMKARSLNK